jgi:hypothetical protein
VGAFMGEKSKSNKDRPEKMRKRLENSLPWSLSRWFSNLWEKKK